MSQIVDNQIYRTVYNDLFDLYLPQPDRYISAMGQTIEELKQDVTSMKGRIAALEEKSSSSSGSDHGDQRSAILQMILANKSMGCGE